MNAKNTIYPEGEERYTTFNLQPRLRAKGKRWQYSYRHTDGSTFRCIGHSLEQCRERRDEWLQGR